MTFSKFSRLCDHQHNPDLDHFGHLSEVSPACLQFIPILHQPQAAINLHAVSRDSSILDI